MSHDLLRVDLGPRSYDIVVGDGLLDAAGTLAAPLLDQERAVIVADSNTGPLFADRLRAALRSAGVASECIVLPAGEATKDFDHLDRLVDDLLERRVERRTTLFALGGGVIGDLAGFAAAVTLRGLPFIQVPTTLLAQVDSSVGGKTGINTRRGKNLVGAFYQPRLVLADTGTLDSLDRRQRLAGYAEVVKYGLIDDPAFFDWLDHNGTRLIDGDDAARRHAVLTSCRAKARVVAADERESGRRALLNLGHTFGHALEAETGYGERLLHGEAVGLGMLMAFDLSARLGMCPDTDAARLRGHLEAVGLPTRLGGLFEQPPSPETLLAHMSLDKKVQDGRITFVLARGIGAAVLARDVPAADLRWLLADYLGDAA